MSIEEINKKCAYTLEDSYYSFGVFVALRLQSTSLDFLHPCIGEAQIFRFSKHQNQFKST